MKEAYESQKLALDAAWKAEQAGRYDRFRQAKKIWDLKNTLKVNYITIEE